MSRSGSDSPHAPACLAEALALIEAGLDFVNGVDVPGLPVAVQADALRIWVRLDAKRTAAEAALVNAFDAAGGYAADGQSATSSWLAFFTRCTAAVARQTVAAARRLRGHPHVARALAAGRIPASVGTLIVDFGGRLPAEHQDAAERVLTDVAAAGADAADLSVLATEIHRRVYPDGIDRDEQRVAADRGLTLGKTFGGADRLNADLTAHATSLAEQVIGALAGRKGPQDTRTARQRRHDAFVEALSLLAGSNLMPERGGAKPQIKIDIPLAALRRLPGATDAVNQWIRLKARHLPTTSASTPNGSNTPGPDTADSDTASSDTAGLGTAGPGTAGLGAAGPEPGGPGTAGSVTGGLGRGGPDTASPDTAGQEPADPDTADPDTAGLGRGGTGAGGPVLGGPVPAGLETAGLETAGLETAGPDTVRQDLLHDRVPDRRSGSAQAAPQARRHARPSGSQAMDAAADVLTGMGMPPASVGPPATLGGADPISERTAAALACDSLIMPTVTGAVDQQALTSMTEEWLHAHRSDDAAGCGCNCHQPATPDTRLRLRQTLLRWAVEVLSGPGGLASFLRTGHYEGPLAEPSIVLDVGRPTKTVPTHLEQAVRRRDRHCRWPGCDRPAELSQVHHIVPRAAGGRTSLGNLLTLCDFHHLIAVHTWGWTIHLAGDGTTTATSPAGHTLHETEPHTTGPPPGTGPPETAEQPDRAA